MKKAPPVRLSLRKLFVAMLAVGPVAILPSPLLAAVPPTTPFTTSSGTATWAANGNTGTITASNRAVLVWGTDPTDGTNFIIPDAHTFNFNIQTPGGAVLNRVSGVANATVTEAAVINGTLLSNGQVVILANGNISVGAGAQISTAGGLVLSTLSDTNQEFNFTSTGNLNPNTTSTGGSIILGSGNTATVLGNLTAYAGAITANNLTVSGDLILNQTGNTTLALTTGAAQTNVGGNLTVITNNADIAQGTGALVVASGSTALRSGTGSITLNGSASNDFRSVSINTTGSASNVSITDANIITLGASTIGNNLTVNAAGTRDSTAIATNGTLTIGGSANFTAATGNSAINIGNNTTIGSTGTLNITTNNSAITFAGAGNVTTGTINSGTSAAAVTGPPAVTANATAIAISTNGVLTVGDTISNGAGGIAGNITLTGASIAQGAGVVSAGNGTVTLNATTGNITAGEITANSVTLNASAGSISQAASTILTTSGGTSVFRSAGNINLNQSNDIAGTIQLPSASSANITNVGDITLGTSNVTGNVALVSTGGNVILGAGTGTSAQNITVGGTLFATTSGGSITDGNYSTFNVAGGVNLTTGNGNVVLDAALANGSLAPNVQFGQVAINAGTGNVTVAERTTLNLGNISANILTASSIAGDIINSGNVTATTASFSTSGASTSVITNGTNNIGTVNFLGSGGALTVANDVTLGVTTNVTTGDDLVLTSTNGNVTLSGGTIGGHLAVTAGNIISTSTGNTTVGGNLSLTAASTDASSINQTAGGGLIVNGVTTIASAGNVALTGNNDFIGSVVLNQASSTGSVAINDINNLSVSGNSGGNVTVRAGGSSGAIDGAWSLVLGNLNVSQLTANATNGGGGNSGTVTQAPGTSLHVENGLTVTTQNANIVLTNSGNSAGRVQFGTNGLGNGAGTISYTEDGTMRVGNIAANSTITLRSNFGSIIEDTNASVALNARGTLNATAPNGSILLGGTTQSGTITTTGNVATFVASAPTGTVAIQSTENITLGAINANSLTVVSSNNITQSAALNVFGPASFTSTSNNATEARSITLTNNANNFGPVSVTTNSGITNVAVTEGSTLNLRRVSVLGGGNGTFTATSVNGDIIDTGLGGVKLGGNATATPGNGSVSLIATNGNIVIDDPTSDVLSTAGILFNGRDVTLSILGGVGSSLVLGSASGPSTASGNLTVSTALGSIANAGTFTAGGTAFFQAPNGNITINQPGVGFGALKFIGQQVSISEGGNMDILTGSAAFGPANLVSGGNISFVDAGGVATFASTVFLTATGNITPAKLIQAAGLLTVTHTGTADLGALSIAGDLGGITPVDAGTGTYVAPQP